MTFLNIGLFMLLSLPSLLPFLIPISFPFYLALSQSLPPLSVSTYFANSIYIPLPLYLTLPGLLPFHPLSPSLPLSFSLSLFSPLFLSSFPFSLNLAPLSFSYHLSFPPSRFCFSSSIPLSLSASHSPEPPFPIRRSCAECRALRSLGGTRPKRNSVG